MKSMRWFVAYILVASFGLWLAFAASMKFMTPAGAQGAPSSGELPAEFLQEVESTQVPAPPTTAPAKAAPAATPQPGAVPSQVPPPPVDEANFGDGATAPDTTNVLPQGEPVSAPVVPQMTYDPESRRDPFKAFRAVRPVIEPGSKVNIEPLQRYEIEKLQVVGILWDVRTPRAMLKDPEGAVHTIVKNSKVGRNEGFVAAIREGEVVVVETLYDDGKVLKETRVMELSK